VGAFGTDSLEGFSGATNIRYHDPHSCMVATTERDDMTWYQCEECGLMFDDQSEAEQHETNCDSEDPSYIQ